MLNVLKMNFLLKRINISSFKWKSNVVIKEFSTSLKFNVRVALCGCSGGVGQPLALLLKMSPLISELALYDVQKAVGVGADISHINTRAKTKVYSKPDQLDDALDNKNIVIISAGKPRKAGMNRKELFKDNANITRELVTSIIRMSPRAAVCIITNPINTLVPVAAEILKRGNVFDPRKLFGITTIDSVRASTFLAELLCYDSSKTYVPVIGGHCGNTIVPILSQANPPADLPKDKIKSLTERIQNGGTEIVNAKGDRSATLGTAFACARFVLALCRAMKGESNIVEPAYVQSDFTDAKFFATPLLLGPEGLKKNYGFGKLNDYECCLIDRAVKELVKEMKMVEDYFKEDKDGKK